jgi:4-amino-4-deoxy-L-arabinose transferase-like glycosyltransferase
VTRDSETSSWLPILALLLAFLSAGVWLHRHHEVPMLDVAERDGIDYMRRASGPVFSADPNHGIGYPLAIRAVKALGPDSFSAAKIVSLASGAVLVFSVWWLFAALGSRRVGLFAAALAACSGQTLIWSVTILSDMLAASAAFLAVTLLLVPKRSSTGYWLLAGAACGVAYLTRHIYLVFLALPILLWALEGPRRSGLGRSLRPLAGFLAGFLVVTLPWLVYMGVEHGNPFWNRSYLNVAWKMYGGRTDPALPPLAPFPDPERFSGMLDVIQSDPSLFFGSWAASLLRLPVAVSLLVPPVGALAVVGLLFWVRSLDRRRIVFLLANLGYAVTVTLVWIHARFILIFIPVVALGVACAVAALPRRIEPSAELPAPLASVLRAIPLRGLAAAAVLLAVLLQSLRSVPAHFAP